MLTVRILCVGKLKERYWSEACAEYAKRLKAFCKFSIEEIPESRLPGAAIFGGNATARWMEKRISFLNAQATASSLRCVLKESFTLPRCWQARCKPLL